ncbi:alpha/beta hydrolase [Mycolicibacterium sp. CH28]|uniref:alpha/beta hydrolase n=1 Tax=Mycolicibacterium sp. CH28 TaxID=2512237 RepID=UPI001081946E|nr:alpha/beta hydrolase [Mycolicibacterium sp. CH28]TGD90373.1 alpha/beta hydrolase [Mycolicibacterium sp. CH28]
MPSLDRPPVDAILQKVLDAVPFQLSVDGGIDEARRRLRELPRRPVHPDLRVEDQHIDGPAGPIPVRVYWPDTVEAESSHGSLRSLPPVTMYFHGGGFAVGDLDTHDGTAREHAVAASSVVVSVGYRLAPEHPYPAAVDDAWAATRWVADNADRFGADASRLAVAGDSAGGTLAAVVAQLAREAGAPRISFQLLWYPSTMWDTSLPSFAENADAPVLDNAAISAFTRWYAGHLDLSDPPPGLAPGRAADLTGLPSAYIAVAGHDPLRDDGARYAELLAAAGVTVDLHNADTLVHGYLGYAGVVPAATEATARGLAALRTALHD